MAARAYGTQGYVETRVALLICIGFLIYELLWRKALDWLARPGFAACFRYYAPADRAEDDLLQVGELSHSNVKSFRPY